MSNQTADGSLLARTRTLLRESEQSYLDIYEATKLTPNWLSLLARGKLREPSVNKVQKLYEHLSGKPVVGE